VAASTWRSSRNGPPRRSRRCPNPNGRAALGVLFNGVNPLGVDDIEIHETLADLLSWDDSRLPMVRARIDHRSG
jgi:hypothetical protein